MNWLRENSLLLGTLFAAGLGVWWLMPGRTGRSRAVGLILALAGAGTLGASLGASAEPLTDQVLFALFGGGAVLCGILMITSRNPVYGALWFALVTLCTCGLFLLQSAAFLAAATIIVYAGAIIVTFLFVIMLSQQAGATIYDQRSRQPLAATIAGFVLLGVLLSTIQTWAAQPEVPSFVAAETTPSNPLSRVEDGASLNSLQELGRSLFGDYLFAVEIAGTLLLVASIGAIAIAPRRAQGTL
jgi:NADH-quinone oxidoreductase subunit J